MRFSLRHKILGVLGVLLLVAVCFYTVLASLIFSEQKTALLYDLNHSIAVNTAAQLRSSLFQIRNQLRLYSISHILTDKSQLRLPADYLKDTGILGIQLYKTEGDSFTPQKLPGSLAKLPIDFQRLLPKLKETQNKEMVFWKETQESNPLHFLLATKINVNVNQKPETYIAVSEIDGKPLFETLQSTNIFKSYLVKTSGDVLIHCDRNEIVASTNIRGHPLLSKAPQKSATSGVSSFSFEKENWYGAYAPVGMGDLFFISQASKKEVTAAITTLIQRSLFYGIIVITLTFIASILFSKKLTNNISILTSGARRIEKGDLDSKIDIRSRDEIQELAASFNAMMDSLKASREEIEKYNRELEDKVALRTSQLQERNSTIKEVQEKLLKATQLAAVGEVAGRTAHELLNPLTAIISRLERSRNVIQTAGSGGSVASMALPLQLAEIISAWETDYKKGGMENLVSSLQNKSSVNPKITLLEEDLDNLKKLTGYWKEQTEVIGSDLDFVHGQSQRIHRIIDRMRELARSSVKSDVHCHKALEEAVQTMSDFLKKHDVILESELKAETDFAHLNRDELIQIITNLIRNAHDAIESHSDPERRKKGKISVHSSRENGNLIVDILDNGIGITEEVKNKVFEQGFTTKAPSEGTGLGLAICRRYAHAFGGEVELLYSEPDSRGTCFRLSVPLIEAKVKKAS